MKTVSDCCLCLLKLAHTSSDAVSATEPVRMEAVKAALRVLSDDDFSRIPPAIARDVLEKVYEVLGTPDPFAGIKAMHNRQALEISGQWAQDFLAEAKNDEDRLARALRAALVGNMMDMATLPGQSDPGNFREWIDVPWSVHDWDDFRLTLKETGDVLYLLDNAGEVAFDRVLVKELLGRGKRVTLSVKSGPALNDATIEDAIAVGLEKLEGSAGRVTIITTGRATMGVDLALSSGEWKDAFESAGMVIAKGQANLESLHNCGRSVFFITLVKCSHVARYYGLAKGAAMLYKGGRESGMDQG